MTIAPSSTDLAKLALFASILAPREVTADSGEKTGKLWHITIIKAGRALTGDEYPAEVLRDSLDIFRNLPIYSFRFGDDAGDDPNDGFHHLPEGVSDDPRGQPVGNLIGQVTEEVWWSEENQAIEAFAAIDDTKIRDRLKNAYARGAIGKGADVDVFGFSIFAEVLKNEMRVAKFVKGNSLDLVTRPAAGGAFVSIVAEAPPLPLLKALRAEGNLEEDAMQRIVLEEVSRRVDAIVFHDNNLTPEQKRAALVELAQSIIGTMGQGASPDAIESAALEQIEAARKQITDTPLEGIMDAATITKLVAETVTAELKKAKTEDADQAAAAAAAARAADPLDELKVWLESLQGEERMSALQQVQAMLAGLGAMVEAGAGAGLGADEFAALTAELKAVTEEKDAKLLRAKLAKVVEGFGADAEKTDAEKELDKMRAEMRGMAITRELDKLTPELKLKDAQAALILADVSGVTVKGMEVTGLREAIEAVIKEKTYLVETVAAGDGDGGKGAGDGGTDEEKAKVAAEALEKAKAEAETAKLAAEKVAAEAKTKADELQALSAATIRESIGVNGVGAIPEGLAGKIKNLQMRARQGDTWAALEYGRMRKKLIGGAA